ncbi:MAG: DUF354 domain-containing protein [Candidatus Brocadiia bacterium]
MRALFDISHPAHVHFFKHIVRGLEGRGHETSIVARDKDVTLPLLDHYGFQYVTVGRSGHRTMVGQFAELVRRDWVIRRVARRFRPDVILTRNPCGVQVARLVGAVGVFDTDNGREAGIHLRAALPFAHIITSPDCLPDHFGPKHVKYPGYKQTAYLHPNHFSPDPGVRDELGVGADEPYCIVRFVAMDASHDAGHAGLDLATKAEIIEFLRERTRVFITCEGPVPEAWAALELSISPHRIHDALAFARLCVGDSGSMAAEAALLGRPGIFCHSFAGSLSHLGELEERYGLAWSFKPHERGRILEKLDELVSQPPDEAGLAAAHQRLLAEKCDVAQWMCDALDAWACRGGDLQAHFAQAAERPAGGS